MSLATVAWTTARGRTATGRFRGQPLRAELDRAHTEISLLEEEWGKGHPLEAIVLATAAAPYTFRADADPAIEGRPRPVA